MGTTTNHRAPLGNGRIDWACPLYLNQPASALHLRAGRPGGNAVRVSRGGGTSLGISAETSLLCFSQKADANRPGKCYAYTWSMFIINSEGDFKMKARITLSVILVLMMSFASVVSVSADDNTSQTATTIYNETPVSGTLMGSHGGAYWYASFDNPGNEGVVTIDMTFSPADPVTIKGVGFNLYSSSNGQLIGSGKLADVGLLELKYTSDKAEQLLLQVFNYIEDDQMNFTITAEGLPTVSTVGSESPEIAPEVSVAVEEPVAVVEEPVAVVEAPVAVVVPPMSGTLVGNAGGAFTRYSVTFDSAESVTLDMFYTPSDQLINKGVDFMVYGPDGEVDVKVATDTFGQIEATFTPVVGQKYMVQVENYIQDILISYNIHSSANPVSVTTGD